ncbi:MAG: KH domain-containing protein, partial [Patescibacteria group bacterium]
SALLREIKKPKILVINKMDVYKAPYVAAFEALAGEYDEVVKLSAQTGQHTSSLLQAIFQRLPEGEPSYAAGQWTNMDNAFWFAELIREKLFLRLNDELPYSLTVRVDELDRRPDGTLYVRARILTSHERYKGMIIGKGGRGIREIGQSARKEIEGVIGGKAFLELTVEVDPHWTEEFKIS